MSNLTAAQEEFQNILSKNNSDPHDAIHPEDREDERAERAARSHDDEDEEEHYRQSQIDAAMRMPAMGGQSGLDIQLPPSGFDSGHATGVKGVIADARNYEAARKNTFMSKVRQARRSVFGGLDSTSNSNDNYIHHQRNKSDSDNSLGDKDEESFLTQWRESRRRELEDESRGSAIRTRRTSPSVRLYGRFDEVDALGYLDAIEKVGRETVVCVFVYDHECQASAIIEHALIPLVSQHPTVHFVKVHYEDIEFDNAAVPAVLAYRNQGDLFANLTGIIEMIPEDEDFDTGSLKKLFSKHGIV